jgi:hypothetical protein
MTGMTEPPERYVYGIDASDTISFVSPEWLRFAQDNQAPELTEPAVVGKPIWQFITGAETRVLYEDLFRGLRARPSEIIVPFRCDSSTVIRHMSLTLRSRSSGGIECEGRLLQAEVREPIDILSRWVARSDASVPICSLCRRLLVGEDWTEAGVAIVRARLFCTVPVPRLAETVCPTCGSRPGLRPGTDE